MKESDRILEKLVTQLDTNWEKMVIPQLTGAKQSVLGEAAKYIAGLHSASIRIEINKTVIYQDIKVQSPAEVEVILRGIRMTGAKATIIDK